MHSSIETSKLIKLKKRQERFDVIFDVTVLPSPEFVKHFLIVCLIAIKTKKLMFIHRLYRHVNSPELCCIIMASGLHSTVAKVNSRLEPYVFHKWAY